MQQDAVSLGHMRLTFFQLCLSKLRPGGLNLIAWGHKQSEWQEIQKPELMWYSLSNRPDILAGKTNYTI